MAAVKPYIVFVVDPDHQRQQLFAEALSSSPHVVYHCRSLDEARAILQGVLADIMVVNLGTEGLFREDFFDFIRKRCPHAIRIAVGDEESHRLTLLKLLSTGKVHRTMSLPWEENNLVELFVNDLATRSKVRLRRCWRFLQSGKAMPSQPEIVRELEEVLADHDFDLAQVVDVLRKDPVISARLLQVVNSAAFPKTREITDLLHAVTYLGTTDTRNILLFLCATKYFRYPRRYHGLAKTIINHSLRCSRLAGLVAEEVTPGYERVAATAGLLHDIGKLVLLSALGERRFNNHRLPETLFDNDNALGEEMFGVRHQELGSALMLWWNLPLTIVEAVANQAEDPEKLRGVARCVAIADRCLKLAESRGECCPELERMRDKLPLEEWVEFAQRLLAA